MPSLQTPYQHPQVPHPVHFGGPNMHMQPPNVAPMALSMGNINTPQIQQQVFFQGLPSHPMHQAQAQGHGFATHMGAQTHPQLGGVGVGASPQTPLQVMHKAERKYQVGAVADEEQAKQRKFKGILNKLTPQNFEKMLEQLKSVNIDNAFTCIGLVTQIFDKALMEPKPTFGEMYADLCFHLSEALPDFNEDGEKITFKRLIINKCQEEFERGEKEAGRVPEEGQTEEEREEKRLSVRKRMICNFRLIGELYKKRILTEKIMHACIQKLLGDDQEDPHEENIEALCTLMSTIGVNIDHRKAKVHMDGYFKRMKMLSCKQELSSRVRFMLINAMDLRKNKWQERRKVEGPKKTEEMHRDAGQERSNQANRLSRGPSMNSSARRGHVEYSPRGGGGMLSPPSAQMGGFHGPPQGLGFGNQGIRFDERSPYEPRMVPVSQRSGGEEPITLGTQGGLRIEDFKPPAPNRSKILDKFT